MNFALGVCVGGGRWLAKEGHMSFFAASNRCTGGPLAKEGEAVAKQSAKPEGAKTMYSKPHPPTPTAQSTQAQHAAEGH